MLFGLGFTRMLSCLDELPKRRLRHEYGPDNPTCIARLTDWFVLEVPVHIKQRLPMRILPARLESWPADASERRKALWDITQMG